MKNKTAITDPSDEEVIEAMRQSNPNRIDGRTAIDVLALHVGNLKYRLEAAERRLADAEEAKDNYRRESHAQYERTEKLSKLAVRQKDALYDAHVELENHRRHAMLCPQHFQNKDPWVRESALIEKQKQSDAFEKAWKDSLAVEAKLRDVLNRAWLNEKNEAPEEGFVSWTMKILEEGMAR